MQGFGADYSVRPAFVALLLAVTWLAVSQHSMASNCACSGLSDDSSEKRERPPAEQFAIAVSRIRSGDGAQNAPASADARRTEFKREAAEIIASVQTIPLEGFTEDDLVALMHCAEILKDRELSLGYALEVRKRNAKSQEWVLPAIRCLLNLKRVGEAEKIVELVDSTFPTGVTCRSGHLLLFAATRQSKAYEKAVFHLDSHFRHLLDAADAFGSPPTRIGRYLQQREELRRRLNDGLPPHHGVNVLLRESIARRTAVVVNGVGRQNKDRFAQQLLAVNAMSRALTNAVQPAEVPSSDAETLKILAQHGQSVHFGNGELLAIAGFVSAVPSHSHHWDTQSADRLVSETESLRVALRRKPDNQQGADALSAAVQTDKTLQALEQLDKRLTLIRRYRLLEGKSIEPFSAVGGPFSGSPDEEGKQRIFVFWKPSSRVSIRDISTVCERSIQERDSIVVRLAIPSARYHWDDERKRLVLGRALNSEDETTSLQQFLKDQKSNAEFRVVSPDSDVVKFFAGSEIPVCVIVGADNLIRRVEFVDDMGKADFVLQKFAQPKG